MIFPVKLVFSYFDDGKVKLRFKAIKMNSYTSSLSLLLHNSNRIPILKAKPLKE